MQYERYQRPLEIGLELGCAGLGVDIYGVKTRGYVQVWYRYGRVTVRYINI